MTDIYTPVIRALVAASLMLATATLMLVAVSTARAAGALAIGTCGALGEAFDFVTSEAARQSAQSRCQGDACRAMTTSKHGCAVFVADFANPCGAQGWDKGPKLGRSQNDAPANCYKGSGKDGVIRTCYDAKG